MTSFLARLGVARESDFIGLRDHDVFPRALADTYLADDREVLNAGRPLVNRLELWLDDQGRPDWCVITKIPIHGRDGRIVGLIGVTRRDLGRSTLKPASAVTRACTPIKLLHHAMDRPEMPFPILPVVRLDQQTTAVRSKRSGGRPVLIKLFLPVLKPARPSPRRRRHR